MARDEFTRYREAARVGDIDTEESLQGVLDFANERLTPSLWTELERHGGVAAFDKDGEPTVRLKWLLREPGGPSRWSLPRGRAGLAAALKLQRELRDMLAALVQGDVEPAERFVASGGPYRCRVVAQDMPASPHGTGRRRTRRGANAPARSWQLVWESTRTRGARAILLRYVDDVLRHAARLGRCEHCDSFYLRSSRWATRPRRFCSEHCSVAFHNERKLAARRKERAREREEHTEG
jgi:hypothetical protein